MQKPIIIASRRSPLAVAQAEAVRAMLGRAAGLPETAWADSFPLKTFVTIGDKNLQSSLAEVGGKGLFVKEIEMALLTGEAQVAVHSMKDMPAEMPKGLVQAAVPKREDPRDAFVTLDGAGIETLPQGAKLGTSSIRRAAQILRRRPDLDVVPFRGNVQTRLEKLEAGVAAGTFLAEAGLRRLGRDDVRRLPIDPDVMLPALGQGALCIQARGDDEETLELCRKISDPATELASAVERAFVARLDGSCRTPMAGLAEATGTKVRFRAEILHPDGQMFEAFDETFEAEGTTPDDLILDALAKGGRAAEQLLSMASAELKAVIAGG
ncbi:hydroxymethylbilane synthase [Parvularcula sp. ZS-1/3]|uniref:Porphobilinogen deaminase n=1 Tax=Parvularcula mediterranea TaxID=2732508 RepID=A0A7Y3W5B7_9PROT|nr:hydroxymethylbilane synthase [Parvularcula mediterranea]NNU16101.1 hydroxymethylbilane synthase [Parvularcula mediterranea]